MPMMNSEARKRATTGAVMPNGANDPRLAGLLLADRWDAEADHEDSCGNGFAAVVLHAKARELRATLTLPLSA
jgi:hypothetical protein